jgi:hypothetical protein
MTTKPDTQTLTPQQEAVVDLLAIGSTVTDAASAAGIARQTVSEWLNHNYMFRAELNRRRNELWRDRTERLCSLVPKALDVLERELDGERALTAAIHVLKATSLYGVFVPRGETDPEEIEADERSLKIERSFSRFGS